MVRVLIIDDDRELCRILTKVIRSENMEADCCFNGKDGLKKLQEEVYQLVILDVMMHDIDGFETLELLRKNYELPVLMLTARDDSRSKVRGLRAGADDYLTKPFNMDELIARVVSLTRRYTLFNHEEGPISQHLSFGSLHIDVNNRSVESDNGTFTLPPKEFDILLYLIQNQGRILTKKQIYNKCGANLIDTMTTPSCLSSADCEKRLSLLPAPRSLFTRSKELGIVLIQRCDSWL